MMNKKNNALVLVGFCSSTERQMIKKQTNTRDHQRVTNAMKKRIWGDRMKLREREGVGRIFF